MGGGKSLGTAMWLLVPRGQTSVGRSRLSTFLKHSVSVKNIRIPHCLSQYLEPSGCKAEEIPRMAAVQSLHQRLAFQALATVTTIQPLLPRFECRCAEVTCSPQPRKIRSVLRHMLCVHSAPPSKFGKDVTPLTDLCIPGEKGHASNEGNKQALISSNRIPPNQINCSIRFPTTRREKPNGRQALRNCSCDIVSAHILYVLALRTPR
jgi:hypothetical protein